MKYNTYFVLFMSMLMLAMILSNTRSIYSSIKLKKNKLTILFPLLFIIVEYYIQQNGLTLLKSTEIKKSWNLFYSQKLTLIIIETLMLVTYGVLKAREDYLWQRRNISILSIKEGLDLLPVGLCSYSDDDITGLVNLRMDEICGQLFGMSLRDGRDFEERLRSGAETESGNFLAIGENPIIRMDDDSILIFAFNEFEAKGLKLHEILAFDITEEYKASIRLKEENALLEKMNARLRALNKKISGITVEKETLNAKLGIHDSLGQFLLFSKYYLLEEENKRADEVLAERKRIHELWDESIRITEKSDENKKTDAFAKLMSTAEKVGVKIVLRGRMPEDEEIRELIVAAVHESLTNCIRHAGADELTVKIDEAGDYYRLAVTNNGRKPEGKIKLGGGLGNLKKLAESKGTVMETFSFPHFELRLAIKK